MTHHVLEIDHLDPAQATGETARVLDKAKAGVGFVPNMYRSMGLSPGLLETYLDGYERFRNSGAFSPQEQEVVFLTISQANGCDYCLAAHTMIALKQSGLSEADTEALRDGRPLPTGKYQALARFTRHMLDTRGRPEPDEVRAFHDAGFEDRHVLEIILALAVKTISNYSNHVTAPQVDEVFSAHAPKAA